MPLYTLIHAPYSMERLIGMMVTVCVLRVCVSSWLHSWLGLGDRSMTRPNRWWWRWLEMITYNYNMQKEQHHYCCCCWFGVCVREYAQEFIPKSIEIFHPWTLGDVGMSYEILTHAHTRQMSFAFESTWIKYFMMKVRALCATTSPNSPPTWRHSMAFVQLFIKL